MNSKTKDSEYIKDFYDKNQDFVISPFNPFGGISDFGKQIVDRYCLSLQDKRVLDVGCGHGYLLKYLSDCGAETFGVDISRNAIDTAKTISPRSKFSVGDSTKLKYRDNYFGYIYCIETMEHFLDINKVFSEFYRVLKDGGVLVISTPNYFNTAGIFKKIFEGLGLYPRNTFAPFSNWKKQANENFVTVFNVRKRLKSTGFKVVDQFTYNTLHGLLPFLAISWEFYRFWPIRKSRHLVEKIKFLPLIKTQGMNQIVICRKDIV